MQKLRIVLHRLIDAGHIYAFGLHGWDLKVESLERTNLGHEPQKECQQACSESRTTVSSPPFLLIVGPRQIIAKLPLSEIRSIGHNFLLPRYQCHPGHFRNNLADGTAERANLHVLIGNNLAKRHAVGLLKRPFDQRLRDLKTDEVMIAVRGIVVLRYLRDIEAKFRADVRLGIVIISDFIPMLAAKFWELDGHNFVDRGVTYIVRGIVSQGS